MSHSKYVHPNCLNCHYPLAEFDKFCPNCGQKPVAPKSAMHDLTHEFIHSNFHLDGKFFSTLTHIFIPGKLTEAFFKGHHKRYAHPIQLYLVLGGLFLLIMSSISNKAEAKFQKGLEESQSDRKIRRVLATIDSAAQQMPAYKEDPSVKKAIDSLLSKPFSFTSKKSQVKIIRQDYVDCKENLFKQGLKIARLKAQLSPELPTDKRRKMDIIAKNYDADYAQLQQDSTAIIKKYQDSEHSSTDVSRAALEAYFSSVYFGKKLRGEEDASEKWLKDAENDVEIAIKADLAAANDASAIFADGVDVTKKSIKKDSLKDQTRQTGDLKNRLKKPDSLQVSLFSPLLIAQNDLLDVESDDIIKKYKIEGFWRKRFAKRSIAMRQEGATMMHNFIGKFLWIISFSLLPTAAFMYLLYWRQKRYFSEHVVWLLHLNCLIFMLFPLVWLGVVYRNDDISDWILAPFLIISFVAPYIALKRYYKQSWGKTILKGTLFQIAYSLIGALTFLVGGALSFLFL